MFATFFLPAYSLNVCADKFHSVENLPIQYLPFGSIGLDPREDTRCGTRYLLSGVQSCGGKATRRTTGSPRLSVPGEPGRLAAPHPARLWARLSHPRGLTVGSPWGSPSLQNLEAAAR